jgi:hypothetical protein
MTEDGRGLTRFQGAPKKNMRADGGFRNSFGETLYVRTLEIN